MRNEIVPLLEAYADCLAGILPIYQVSVDSGEKGDHIVLRMEGETDISDKTKFVTNPVVVIDIVTRHQGVIDARVVEQYDNEVRQRIWPDRRTNGLTPWVGTQVILVKFEGATYLDGFDGTQYEHRKITRVSHYLNQQ